MAYLLRLKNIGDGSWSRVSRQDQQIVLALLADTHQSKPSRVDFAVHSDLRRSQFPFVLKHLRFCSALLAKLARRVRYEASSKTLDTQSQSCSPIHSLTQTSLEK